MALNPSASEANFLRLQQNEDWYEASLDWIAAYLQMAFENPAAEEVGRWTLSCLPATNGSARLFTLNIGPMEVLHLERPTLWADDTRTWRLSIYVSRSAFEQEMGRPIASLAEEFPGWRFVPSALASGDGDAVVIVVDLLDDTATARFDRIPESTVPVKKLADDLSAKGKGSYEQYHNKWFAAAALEWIERNAAAEGVG